MTKKEHEVKEEKQRLFKERANECGVSSEFIGKTLLPIIKGGIVFLNGRFIVYVDTETKNNIKDNIKPVFRFCNADLVGEGVDNIILGGLIFAVGARP